MQGCQVFRVNVHVVVDCIVQDSVSDFLEASSLAALECIEQIIAS